MPNNSPNAPAVSFAAILAAVLMVTSAATATEPVALRAENFTVPPSTGPVAHVVVRNLQENAYQGAVTFKGPAGWRIAPAERRVSLAAGETKRVPFTIERATNVEANLYAVEVSATGGGTTVVRKQNVHCASAPYFKPTIDGKTDEWKDAIPLSFDTGGRKTTISTYWNRRQFSLLVAVEEDELTGRGTKPDAAFDAVQIAISPQDTETGTSPDAKTVRYEFLLVRTGSDTAGKCFQLARPGMKLAETQKRRDLGPIEYIDAKVAVARNAGVTYYECSIPFGPIRGDIRPGEGREFFLSVLVHDPDGTGLRDLGAAVGLWPSQRNRLAFSDWSGAKWPEIPPFDNKIRWGLCASKY